MDASSRRDEILSIISAETSPISASLLARNLNVSRQVIVGDVALLRAQGNDITATARGYIIASKAKNNNEYLGKIACIHTESQAREEVYTIIDLGATVVNVIVEHEIYGEVIGKLNLKTREDIDVFTNKVKTDEVKLLSDLTDGVHLHMISCRDKAHFDEVVQALRVKGFEVSSF